MDTAPLLTSAIFVGAVVLGLQLADAVLALIDAHRVAGDGGIEGGDGESDADALTRRRLRELSWTVIVTAALAVVVAFGTDSAARQVWDERRPVVGALILLAVTVLSFAVGVIAIVAVVRRERPTYARIRRDLRDRSTSTLDAEELAEFDERLARADLLRGRGTRAALWLRVIALLVMVGLLVVAIARFPVGGIVSFAIAAAVSLVALVIWARTRTVTDAALQAVLDAQRTEVVALLERARIPARGRVPGLRDRVSRALAILREQQK